MNKDKLNNVLVVDEKPNYEIYPDGGMVLFHPLNGRWLKSSIVAKSVIEHAAKAECTTEEVIKYLSGEYNISFDSIAASVVELIDALINIGVIHYKGTGRASEYQAAKTMLSTETKHTIWIDIHDQGIYSDIRCDSLVTSCASEYVINCCESITPIPRLVGLLIAAIRSNSSAKIRLDVADEILTEIEGDILSQIDELCVHMVLDESAIKSTEGISYLNTLCNIYPELVRSLIFKLTASNVHMLKYPEVFYSYNIDSVYIANTHNTTKESYWSFTRDDNSHYPEYISAYRSFLELHGTMIRNLGTRSSLHPIKYETSFDYASRLFSKGDHSSFCTAGSRRIYINCMGDVYPCAALASNEAALLGTVADTGIDELLNKARQWRSSVFNVENDSKCVTCNYKYLCSGGCRYFGELQYRDKQCDMLEILYREYLQKLRT